MGHGEKGPAGYDVNEAQLRQAEKFVKDPPDAQKAASAVEGVALSVRGGLLSLGQMSPQLRTLVEESLAKQAV